MTQKPIKLLLAILLASAAACSVGPDYKKPDAPTATAFKEQVGWKASDPKDEIDRGAWWSIYKDPVLDALERKVEVNNQNLKASEAAYRQARAIVDQSRAGFFPTITGNFDGTRTHSGGGTSSRGGGFSVGGGIINLGGNSSTQNSFSTSVGADWDIDVWGRIRRTVEGDIATAQATAGDLASARLSAQSTLAISYFQMRFQEELKRLLDRTAVDFTRSLEITQNQYNVGVAAKADVLSARTQLLNAQSSAVNSGVQRATLEHAIAVLVGEPAGDFSIAPTGLPTDVPVAPVGLPSTLLERRPDIAAAERRMAAANAQIGVAIAAYFPDLTLSPSYGFSGSHLGHLIGSATNVWSLGASLTETIFDAGARSAQVEQARASFDQNVALYRESVLEGFQQVEDQLAALRILEQQSLIEDETVKTAREAERLTLNQYKAGTVPFSSVITAQATALNTEQTALNVVQNRLTASVSLVQAVGGGWDASKLPGVDQVEDDMSFLKVIPISTEHPTSSDGK
jgi:NodT family efflux transporter outer membrane factor (OMF) lipoprotein